MRFEKAALESGIAAGTKRGRDAFPALAKDLPSSLKDSLFAVLAEWPSDAHSRFVSLFAELSAIAAISRIANNEPPLSQDELRFFLGHTLAFFNSFKHR